MAGLWTVLGYDEIAASVTSGLQKNADLRILEGPPGVGKTWLAHAIGALWEETGGAAVFAAGDWTRSDVPYQPFLIAMTGLSGGWRDLMPTATDLAQASEALAGTRGQLTVAIRELTEVRKRRRQAKAPMLTPQEHQILHDMEVIAKGRPVLLIADDLHWWDGDSLGLVKRLLTREVQAAHPFLSDMRVLGVQTTAPYQQIAHQREHEMVLVSGRAAAIKLEPIRREQFEAVLAALGAPDSLPSSTSDLVFDLTGGHLALAARAAAELARGENLLSWDDGADGFVRQLLTERMYSLGQAGQEAIELLRVAAVIGFAFRRIEIRCATQCTDAEVARLLRLCREALLLDVAGEQVRFVHDAFRQFFLDQVAPEIVEVHERLGDCLRELHPAEYELRAVNALAGDRSDRAAVLATHAALARMREGRPSWEAPAEIKEAMHASGLTEVALRLGRAWQNSSTYQFAECLEELERLPRDLPLSLLAEADYIRGSSLLATRSEHDRALARLILERWSNLADEEPDLSTRIERLLVYGLSHLQDKTPALRREGRLRHQLAERAAYDEAAEDALYSLDRTAASLVTSDAALVRIEEAIAHFGVPADRSELRRPQESYRTLNNYVASLISNARYATAIEAHEQLDQLVRRYSLESFPRPEYPEMNAILAQYRAGRIDAAEAVIQYETSVLPILNANDPFYGRNGYAVFLALRGDIRRGVEEIEHLQVLLDRRPEPEPSMEYLLRANSLCMRFCLGQSVSNQWDDLLSVLDRVNYTSLRVLRRRHELLGEVLGSDRITTPDELDVMVIRRWPNEFGPLWDNFGRGFRMPEVEFWREA